MSKKNRNRVVENTNIQEGDTMGIIPEEVEGNELESVEAEGQPQTEIESTEDQSPVQSEESGDGIEDNVQDDSGEEDITKDASEPMQEDTPVVDEEPETNLKDSFSKKVLLEILDSEVIVDASKATIYNTEEDMRAAAKLEKIYATTVSLGVNHPISKVVSQALKFANTTADKRKGDMLYGTLIREINNASSGSDFDLLIFTVVKIFKSFRTLGELATIRSLRDVKNVEMKAAAQALAHIFAQLATVEDRKKKLNVTISLDKLLKVSSSGLNQNGINLIKEYFSK